MFIFIVNFVFKDNFGLLDFVKVGILIGLLIVGLMGFLILCVLGSFKSDFW